MSTNVKPMFRDGSGPGPTINAVKNAAVPLAPWVTFTCDGKTLSILPNICSGTILVGKVDSKGKVVDPSPVDSAKAYAAA